MTNQSLPELQPQSRGNAIPPAGSEPADAPVVAGNSLAASILNSVSASESKSELIKSIAATARHQCPESFFWYVESSADASQRALALTCADQGALWQTVGDEVIQRLAEFQTTEMVMKAVLDSNPSAVLLATPIPIASGMPEAILAIAPRNDSMICKTESLLALFSLAVQNWLSLQDQQREQNQVNAYQKVIQLSNIIGSAHSYGEAMICCVNFVREMTNAKQVSLAEPAAHTNQMKVRAISDVDTFDRSSEICQAIESICQRACESGNASAWNTDDGFVEDTAVDEPQAAPAQKRNGERDQWHRRYSELTNSPALRIRPLEKHQACMLVAHQDQDSAQQMDKLLNVVATSVDIQLDLLKQSNRSALQISRDRVLATIRTKTWRTAGAILLAVFAAMLIPMPYVVKCDCQLEPVHRRFVAAPFDGVVDKALVQDGDVVVQGQSLALLDGRQLRIELAGLQANLQSEKKKQDAALANRDVSTAQIALLNVKQLNSEIDLVRRKLENLQICSPIDGVIVAGDLQKSEGAPVQIGQNLFEIAPLDRMVVEIEIPDSEIRYVRQGQKAKIMFDAFPFEKFVGEIVRVHPQAELRDDESVFVAEVEIQNAGQKLRPGMKGRSRIRSNWQPLGWNLFHGSYESVRAWLVW